MRGLPNSTSIWPYLVAVLVLLAAVVLTQLDLRFSSRPAAGVEVLDTLAEQEDLNVLFIVIDTLRADRLGAYGYERDTSPVMDQLARQGIRFDQVIAQSTWTKTSMASMWTGTYPVTNGILRWNHALPDGAKLPAEILREHGFRTAGIYRNGWVAPNFGFSQGFDNYLKPQPGSAPKRFERSNPSQHLLGGTDEDVTIAAQEFLEAFRNERFFLYLHYMDVHQYAYDELAAQFGTDYSGAYDNSISWVDRNIGALVTRLDELDLFGRTLIVIASDHGESFREHGHEGHARTLYREVTEVPLILAPPYRLTGTESDRGDGIVVEERVQNVDIWPTLFDLLGIEGPAGSEGISLLPAIRAAAKGKAAVGDDRPAFAHLERRWAMTSGDRPVASVVLGPDKLIAGVADDQPSEPELYNRDADPWETTNVADLEPEGVERLQTLLKQYLARGPVPWGEPNTVAVDEMELDQLRALGYVVE